MKAKHKLALAAAAAMGMYGVTNTARATIVYSDNFDRASLNGTYTYTVTTVGTGADGGAFTDGSLAGTASTPNVLTLTNDFTTNAQANGVTYVSTPTSAYSAPFNNVLQNNTGNVLTWTLNMEQIRSSPSGLAAGNYGAAYVLGASGSTFNTGTTGYALVIGNGGTTDAVRLVKFANGLTAISTNADQPANMVLGSTTSAGSDFQSVKVTYDPSSNTWHLFTRDDGTSAFADPTTGTFVDRGSAIDTTYTNVNLNYSGAYWAYSTSANQTARFDNFQLDISAPTTTATPRDLVWASNTTGTWDNANAWLDGAAPATWDSTTPDNATLGNGTGSGTAIVTLAADQTAGSITFAANSPTFTVNGANLTLNGSGGNVVVANQSATLNTSTITVGAAGNWSVASGATLTIGDGTNGALVGASGINKTGNGDVILNTPSPNFTGNWTLNGGTMQINAVNANGVGGNGAGAITVNSGATVWINNVTLGNTGNTGGGDVTIGMTLNNGATLQGTGNAEFSGSQAPSVATASGTVVTIKTVNASDVFDLNSSIRNASSGASSAKIVVSGPGTVLITTGATSASPTGNQYSGTWELQGGLLELAPSPAFGEPENGLGYSPTDGPNGYGNAINVTGGTFAIGINARNGNNTPPISSNTVRARVTLSGGNLASTEGIEAQFAGDLNTTASTTSKLLAYDPKSTSSASNFRFVTESLGGVAGNFNWGANSTLVVDPGSTSGGVVTFDRDTTASPTVTVGAGAKLQINSGAQVVLQNTMDPLYSGTAGVNVVNNSSTNGAGLSVVGSTKNVGAITGTGTTGVDGSSVLNTDGITQGTLNVADGGHATVRPRSVTGSNHVSYIDNLNLNSTGTLDLNDNDLVVNNGNFATIQGLVFSGYRQGADPTATGIISTTGQTSTGNPILAVIDNSLIGSGDFPFGSGHAVAANAVLGKYTYFGDTNLDGQVTADDYGALDANFGATGVNPGVAWVVGDTNFDGSVTSDDYGTLDANFGLGVGNPLGANGLIAANGAAAVPEPASLSLLGVAGVGMLLRRRRSR